MGGSTIESTQNSCESHGLPSAISRRVPSDLSDTFGEVLENRSHPEKGTHSPPSPPSPSAASPSRGSIQGKEKEEKRVAEEQRRKKEEDRRKKKEEGRSSEEE
ncbi:hypothetical protein B296_00019569 [Ensete ventricosum]|uniref:Uncharacterized protein n=1 Tax=Ensete ventricosum TaxID=4639 RepID=A0A426XWQ7_ENSVE|nr:hypothetical protein B296_00019569 [Ensete ventricosum]